MLVGVCKVELFVPESDSLKAKRFVLASIKTRIRNKFNVSVAEIGSNDKWQKIMLGIAVISNERKYIDQVMSEVFKLIENDGRAEITDSLVEIY